MIERARLQELINEETEIYELKNGKVKQIFLNKKNEIAGNHYLRVKLFNYVERHYLKNLFETKEDAEWLKEFGCIERTERLELPTWEEIEKDFNNINKFGTYTVVEFNGGYIDIFVDNYSKKFIVVTAQQRKPLTKENYTIACKKVKKMFLGEKE